MWGLIAQLAKKRWGISMMVVLVMVLMLLISTATIGLLTHLQIAVGEIGREVGYEETYYLPGPTGETVEFVKASDYKNLSPISRYWQVWGVEHKSEQVEPAYLKVLEYDPEWYLVPLAGEIPHTSDEIMVSSVFLLRHELVIGDKVRLLGDGIDKEVRIVSSFEDAHYDMAIEFYSRIFIGGALSDKADGVAFDIGYSKETPRDEFLEAYKVAFYKPLFAEIQTSELIDYYTLDPIEKPILFAVGMWMVLYFIVATLLAMVLKHFVHKAPLTVYAQGRWSSDYLTIYSVYFAMLLLCAYLMSALVVNEFASYTTKSFVLLENYVGQSGFQVAHLISLGIMLCLVIFIGSVFRVYALSRVKKYGEKGAFGLVSQGTNHAIYGLMAIVLVNALIVVMMFVRFTSIPYAEYLVDDPAFGGFPGGVVSIDVNGEDLGNQMDYAPVLIHNDDSDEYVIGVGVSESMQDLGLYLVDGRLAEWDDEVVVGYSFYLEGVRLGSMMSFSDDSGEHEGLVVGIANSFFNKGKVIWYLNEDASGLVLSPVPGAPQLDYSQLTHNRHELLGRSENRYLTQTLAHMILLAVFMLGFCYLQLSEGLTSVFRLIRTAKLSNGIILLSFLLMLLLLTGLSIVAVNYMLVPLLSSFVAKLVGPIGIDISSVVNWKLDVKSYLWHLIGINGLFTVGFVYRKYRNVF
ncbi:MULTISPECIES: hypothetical protein [unclassified Fusibacter]|uniref:hypothetical protein n=1 Tax=unclassified Fusibacter TaxID=2624464 RepID=UPI0010104B77|nr:MULTISPECIES: hypothetical protein [unclassified Fusibacter]MCK8059896.1 hypothetical protein [Fusibacter sp. A2]NPE23894.1 hypothetical protein [Fusibacter sp. A1]RXV58474.1 hypothetical protein DWB64_19095 [Fusibacter sp. A1]